MRMHEDVGTNVKRCIDLIHRAADQGAQIISTPELFSSLYFCQKEDAAYFDLAESIPGPTTDALSKVAKERGITLVGSLFEKRAPGLFHNTAVVIDENGALVGKYRKMHIPDDPNYYEKFYFTPGDLGFRAFPTKHAKVGTLVCWDQWFPEGARLTAMRGAEVLFYPTAIGAGAHESAGIPEKQRQAWITIQRAHAIANGVFVSVANRVGKEGDMRFWGSSFICGPLGEVLAQASDDKEEALVATLDLADIDVVRQGWPFFRDRRIDAYADLSQRFLD
ncbi:MAG: carbon-nitrogen hydrolase [Candidatus Thermoplasmatota archaeon]